MPCQCNKPIQSHCNCNDQKFDKCGCHKNKPNRCDCRKDKCKEKPKKSECKDRNPDCHQYLPCVKTKCGIISASLVKTASPTFYTAVGQIITYSYTITNTGNAPICFPIQIVDSALGGQLLPFTQILPGQSQTFTRTYTITAADLLIQSITNNAVAYIRVKCNKFAVTNTATATITFGLADVSGTITQVPFTDISGATGGIVTVTISNSASSLTPALGVSLLLPFPANVTSVSAPSSIFPATPPVINANTVSISEASIPIGVTYTYEFRYFPQIIPGSYQWAGFINTQTFDPNIVNNNISGTLTFP